MRTSRFLATAVFAAIALATGGALAAQPQPWEWTFQPAATPIMDDVHGFYELLFWIMFGISAFVLAIMGYIALRYRRKRNPDPTRTTHNTMLEVVWTVVPILILVAIAIPSLRLLYYEETIPDADMTIKAIGHQWYWSYEYPDHGGFSFDANLVPDEELGADQPRLLTTDNAVVLPVGQVIRVLVTSTDVIHSWAMPSWGIKTDAVPGRVNEFWVEVQEPGMYYGQCSELCGTLHGYMPIMVRAVPQDQFDDEIQNMQDQFAETPTKVEVAEAAAAQ